MVGGCGSVPGSPFPAWGPGRGAHGAWVETEVLELDVVPVEVVAVGFLVMDGGVGGRALWRGPPPRSGRQRCHALFAVTVWWYSQWGPTSCGVALRDQSPCNGPFWPRDWQGPQCWPGQVQVGCLALRGRMVLFVVSGWFQIVSDVQEWF